MTYAERTFTIATLKRSLRIRRRQCNKAPYPVAGFSHSALLQEADRIHRSVFSTFERGNAGSSLFRGSSEAQNVLNPPVLLQNIRICRVKLKDLLGVLSTGTIAMMDATTCAIVVVGGKGKGYGGSETESKGLRAMVSEGNQ
ncbi:predicted protein [Pyrenophora tritici-repentis Pt-1C-BFP]|uniref:Uncharacterized protein n=1 Tax=Pyrenophora tritici-repentis (strain Pt-1C-BFP) TaxID=426418 RepID=B2WKQ5_PYRTR|nr:uncharacterized protein PTRG_10565 [Pyrenophora tritici-repentis Pt-1C-BFP]EDU43615.1 predicted protein [Pyrenophora tritici-repentis Pt-1C-BFP]